MKKASLVHVITLCHHSNNITVFEEISHLLLVNDNISINQNIIEKKELQTQNTQIIKIT